MTEQTKSKSATEIQTDIESKTAELRTASKNIDSLRDERAQLAVNGQSSMKNQPRITAIDNEINVLRNKIDNLPAELKLLGENLATENQRVAQAESAALLEQQKQVADDVENLSNQFVQALNKANDINEQLKTALSAEAAIRNKTGADVLAVYCHGSDGSCKMLLELMQSQMDGIHTTPYGSPDANIQIRL